MDAAKTWKDTDQNGKLAVGMAPWACGRRTHFGLMRKTFRWHHAKGGFVKWQMGRGTAGHGHKLPMGPSKRTGSGSFPKWSLAFHPSHGVVGSESTKMLFVNILQNCQLKYTSI